MQNVKKILTPFLFFLTFILPVIILYVFYKFYYSSSKEIFVKENKFVKCSFSAKPGQSFKIEDNNLLNPEEGKDFILTSWFKFRKLPKDGERAVLITKYDAKTAYKQGYALAVEKQASTGYRGSLFWQDIHNNGRWYTYGEIPLVTGKWFMFTASYTSNKYLALYYTHELNGEIITELIGAYKVSATPASKSDFKVGSLVSRVFDGRVGTVSIIKPANVDKNLENIIKANFTKPRKFSKLYKKEDVALWTVGAGEDLGKNNLKIIKVGKPKKK